MPVRRYEVGRGDWEFKVQNQQYKERFNDET